MHPVDKQLIDLADKSLSEEDSRAIQLHLAQCPDCARRYQRIEARRTWVGEKFSRLSDAGPIPSTAIARHRLETRLKTSKEKPLMNKKSRSWAAAAAALVVLVALFAIPSVRVFAVNFLGIFRVQQIQVVPFNPANLPEDFEGRLSDFENLVSDSVTYSTDGDPVLDLSRELAAGRAGFNLRLPAGEETYSLSYQPASLAEFTIDLALWQALLESLGQTDVELPRALDGETISVTIPNSVTYLSAGCERPMHDLDSANGAPVEQRACTMLVQLPSPTIEAPAGMPLDRMGRAFLEVLGLSADDAEQFSRSIDWSTTLVVPVPHDADVREVSINGRPGTLFANEFRSFNTYQLMWVQDGIVYALSMDGMLEAKDVISMAESLQ